MRTKTRRLQTAGRFSGVALLVAGFLSVAGTAPSAIARTAPDHHGSPSTSGCQLTGPYCSVQDVIYIQFDNVHYRRDYPSVPSDIQQMPNLLNFFKQGGTFLTNEHTPLIAHTADDIITSLTGVYGDRHGQPISNSFDYYDSSGIPHFTSSFEYWTDPLADGTPYMIDAQGQMAPAPWVPYT